MAFLCLRSNISYISILFYATGFTTLIPICILYEMKKRPNAFYFTVRKFNLSCVFSCFFFNQKFLISSIKKWRVGQFSVKLVNLDDLQPNLKQTSFTSATKILTAGHFSFYLHKLRITPYQDYEFKNN